MQIRNFETPAAAFRVPNTTTEGFFSAPSVYLSSHLVLLRFPHFPCQPAGMHPRSLPPYMTLAACFLFRGIFAPLPLLAKRPTGRGFTSMVLVLFV